MSVRLIKEFVARNLVLYFPVYVFRKIQSGFYKLLCTLPIKNRIVFISYFGKGYNDNPKAVSDCVLADMPNVEIVWIMNKPETIHDTRIKIVKNHTLKSLYFLATSKVWVDNCRKNYYLSKRRNQYYIQTWHGAVSCKCIEGDAEAELPINYLLSAKNDSKMIDLMVSNSRWSTKLYRRAFWYTGEIIECGSPRLDKYMRATEEEIHRLKERNNIGVDEYCVLYAPTFRDDGDMSVYDIDFFRLAKTIETKTGKKCRIMIRMHPNIANSSVVEYGERIVNVTNYADIYELLLMSEILITDYSSTMFEAGYIGKPVFLYARDYEKYMMNRGMYFDIEELPYIFCTNNDELNAKIENFNIREYCDVVQKFNDKLGLAEDGQASRIVSQRICSIFASQ